MMATHFNFRCSKANPKCNYAIPKQHRLWILQQGKVLTPWQSDFNISGQFCILWISSFNWDFVFFYRKVIQTNINFWYKMQRLYHVHKFTLLWERMSLSVPEAERNVSTCFVRIHLFYSCFFFFFFFFFLAKTEIGFILSKWRHTCRKVWQSGIGDVATGPFCFPFHVEPANNKGQYKTKTQNGCWEKERAVHENKRCRPSGWRRPWEEITTANLQESPHLGRPHIR